MAGGEGSDFGDGLGAAFAGDEAFAGGAAFAVGDGGFRAEVAATASGLGNGVSGAIEAGSLTAATAPELVSSASWAVVSSPCAQAASASDPAPSSIIDIRTIIRLLDWVPQRTGPIPVSEASRWRLPPEHASSEPGPHPEKHVPVAGVLPGGSERPCQRRVRIPATATASPPTKIFFRGKSAGTNRKLKRNSFSIGCMAEAFARDCNRDCL